MKDKSKNIFLWSLVLLMLLGTISFPNGMKNVYAEDAGEEKCTVTFDKNGGEWEYDTDTVVFNVKKGNKIEKVDEYGMIVEDPFSDIDGQVFTGWKIKDSQDEKVYSIWEIADMTFDKDTIFEGQWNDNGIVITLISPRGHFNSKSPDKTTVKLNILPGDYLYNYNFWPYYDSEDDCYFATWSMNGSDLLYTTGELMELKMNDSATFTADYDKYIEVFFDANGGKYTNDPTASLISWGCMKNEEIILDLDVTKDGFDFDGWTLKGGDGKKYKKDDLYTVIQEVTFVANWKSKKPGGSSDSKGSSKKTTPSSSPKQSNTTTKKTSPKYSEEWVDGKWYDKDGKQTYSGRLSWKKNSTGWWIEDTSSWYPKNQWQKIDKKWYYFNGSGYMASNEYYNGYWFNSDGSWDSQYYLKWKSNSEGWWVEDKSGWWPSSRWLKIDGNWYYFDSSGYMATNTRVDGYWIGANGVCQ